MTSTTSIRPRRAATLSIGLVASSILLAACARATISTGHARALAVTNACGSRPADTSCVVQNVQRIGSGYVVTIDRRPPVGNDRVRVSVSNGGVTTVLPADTTRRGP
jgi:hypothetical protein